jgi:N6-L-threonylcarbamoyladenine synthase
MLQGGMIILALETSCDETAAALVNARTGEVLAAHVYSQLEEHAPYGGVVPEIASRNHLAKLPQLVQKTLDDAGLAPAAIHAVAATTGPGLTTALAMGTTFAKTLALVWQKPFLSTNHLEGHALSPLLPHAAALEQHFPYLLLLISGGHCQLVMVEGVGRYTQLGTTSDDAVGECFDKVGKLLGLPHPAGPALEKLAATGNASAVILPQPKNDDSLDFSFSGLKTAARDLLANNPGINKADVAAAFQTVAARALTSKVAKALGRHPAKSLVVAGGVAANAQVRQGLQQVCEEHGIPFIAPPLSLCTDNAVMIAFAAGLREIAHIPSEGFTATPRPRWPLAEMSATLPA